jgi:membrane protein implicated in regulation of membrane protease activity
MKRLTGLSLMNLGMVACCAVMLVPVAAFFVMGGTIAGIAGMATAFAPLLICLALHGALFLFMGKSCHGKSDETEAPAVREAATDVPAVARRTVATSEVA